MLDRLPVSYAAPPDAAAAIVVAAMVRMQTCWSALVTTSCHAPLPMAVRISCYNC